MDFFYVQPDGCRFAILDDLDLMDAVQSSKDNEIAIEAKERAPVSISEYAASRTTHRAEGSASPQTTGSHEPADTKPPAEQDHVNEHAATKEYMDNFLEADSIEESNKNGIKENSCERKPIATDSVHRKGWPSMEEDEKWWDKFETKKVTGREKKNKVPTNLEDIRLSYMAKNKIYNVVKRTKSVTGDKAALLRLHFEEGSGYDVTVSSEAITTSDGRVSYKMLKHLAEDVCGLQSVELLVDSQQANMIERTGSDEELFEQLHSTGGSDLKLLVRAANVPIELWSQGGLVCMHLLSWREANYSYPKSYTLKHSGNNIVGQNMVTTVTGRIGCSVYWYVSYLPSGNRYMMMIEGNNVTSDVEGSPLLIELIVGSTVKRIFYQSHDEEDWAAEGTPTMSRRVFEIPEPHIARKRIVVTF